MERVENIRRGRANRPTNQAIEYRNSMVEYYSGVGAVDWQIDHVEDF